MNKKIGTLAIMLCLLLLAINIYINTKAIEDYQEQIQQINTRIQLLDKQIKEFLDKWNVEIMEATAYAPADNRSGLCTDSNPSLTATGSTPGPGTVAVNPKVIKYGTRLWVQGYGWGQALDTGAAMRKRTDLIDVYMDTHSKAMEWGRRKVVVVWEK